MEHKTYICNECGATIGVAVFEKVGKYKICATVSEYGIGLYFWVLPSTTYKQLWLSYKVQHKCKKKGE